MLVAIGGDPVARHEADRPRVSRSAGGVRESAPRDAARAQGRPGAGRRHRRLTGTGPQGRITEEDVRRGQASREVRRPKERSEPLRGVRGVIAEHMARAHREVPPVTWVEECDFEAVDMEKLVATVVKACADELQAFPELNARLDGDAIVYLDRYDIGVAVQTPQGLMVPVVRGCDAKTVG